MIISGKTLSAAEVAEAFGVDQDTILDWKLLIKSFQRGLLDLTQILGCGIRQKLRNMQENIKTKM